MYREVLDEKIAVSMKTGNVTQLAIWRAIKNEFVKFKTSGANMELTDEKELQIIRKMVQQRKDSYEQYLQAGRNDLAFSEEKEMNFLNSLLPKEPTSEEIENVITNFFANRTDKPTMKDMKDVMMEVRKNYPTSDGGLIAKLFREKYIN